MKILIMGLPGSGKTTLAQALAKKIGAVHLNADTMRNRVWVDLGFEYADRLIQAQRMGALSDVLNEQGLDTIADFVCPTEHTRDQFGEGFYIWVDRIEEGRFEDTNKLFQKPAMVDVHIKAGLTVEEEVAMVVKALTKYKKAA